MSRVSYCFPFLSDFMSVKRRPKPMKTAYCQEGNIVRFSDSFGSHIVVFCGSHDNFAKAHYYQGLCKHFAYQVHSVLQNVFPKGDGVCQGNKDQVPTTQSSRTGFLCTG